MNYHMKMQIANIISSCEAFLKSLELSAVEDDGKIDRDEQKTINKAKKETEKYIEKLRKI